MFNKMKVYIKFICCLLMIFSLIIPSMANIASNDGSAFVTKSEFDRALTDFNARLTTFEAGINSKIDSQVTSYLDRNGIWSGKQQELNPSYFTAAGFKDGYRREISEIDTAGGGGTMSLGNISSANSKTIGGIMYAYGFNSYYNDVNILPRCWVKKFNKTGLAFISLVAKPNDGSSRTGCCLYLKKHYDTQYAYQTMLPMLKIDVVFSEETSDTTFPSTPNEKSRYNLTTADFSTVTNVDNTLYSSMSSWVGCDKVAFHIVTGTQNAQFFVSKGNSLWMYYNFIAAYKSTIQKESYANKKADAAAVSGSNTGFTLKFDVNVTVY